RLEAGRTPEVRALSGDLLDRVQTGLDAGTALLSFHLGDSISWLWAVDRSGLALYALPDRQEISTRVQSAARAIREDSPDAREAGARLYRTLFGPLTARFQQKNRWLVALDMDLFEAPLAALVDESAGRR